MKLNKKTLAVCAVTLAVVGGTSAFAYWTTTGDGTGSGTMADSDGSSVTLTTDAIDGLYPGQSTGPLQVYASNASGVDATVETVSAGDITITEAEGVEPGTCDVVWFTAEISGDGAATTVADGASDVSVDQTLTVSMTNESVNQDACKGATIEVALATP